MKQAFGPMFREVGKESPRMKLTSFDSYAIQMSDLPIQSFSENAIKGNGYLFYTGSSVESLVPEQKAIFENLVSQKSKLGNFSDDQIEFLSIEAREERESLLRSLNEIGNENFKTPQPFVFASHKPEFKFTKLIFEFSDLFDAFLKSSDKGFYSFPYSYKPADTGYSHVKRDSFNPDFFFKLKSEDKVLVVEIKDDKDNSQKNKAKLRDGQRHFENLNARLTAKGLKWRYFFFFLSPNDYSDFFNVVKQGSYNGWKSELMVELGK